MEMVAQHTVLEAPHPVTIALIADRQAVMLTVIVATLEVAPRLSVATQGNVSGGVNGASTVTVRSNRGCVAGSGPEPFGVTSTLKLGLALGPVLHTRLSGSPSGSL